MTDLTTRARVLAGIDTSPGDAATAAWSEILSGCQHEARQLQGAFEREYNALHEHGPDYSGRQAARIERLLEQLPAATLANAAGWLDGDADQYDDGGWTDDGAAELDGYDTTQYSTAADKPPKANRKLSKAGSAGSGEHWVTIGAVPGGDGKKHGGVPVLIRGGKIVDGPARLKGKKLSSFGKGRPSDSRLDHAVRSAAKEHDLPAKDLRDAVHFVHGEKMKTHTERENAKAMARKSAGLTAGDISWLANAGHDYASAHRAGGATGQKFRHFDAVAQEVAREHPELGLGDADSKDNFAEGLWNVLAEGKREPLAKHHPDVIQEAVDLLTSSRPMTKADKERYAEMAAIPFSLSGGSGADRRHVRGPAGVGVLPDARGYPRGVTYRRLPRLL